MVTDMMAVYGKISLVRIVSKESRGKLPAWLTVSAVLQGGGKGCTHVGQRGR